MSDTPKTLVECFYNDVWNNVDENVARKILTDDFRFRGSLGTEKRGQDGFIDYMHSIHSTFGDYQCFIEDIITADDRASARMTFQGIHQGTLFDIEPTAREIRWEGAAFFTIKDGRISKLWVLGDIDSIKQQLGRKTASSF